jgi:hypothetical protein
MYRRVVHGVWLECLVYRLWCAEKFNFVLPSPIYDKISRTRSFLIGQTKI